jgi:hypothetical protein
MARLIQIIAFEKSVKSRSFQELTEAHHLLQKPTLLTGIAPTYRPKEDEGEQLPPESTRVQVRSKEAISRTAEILSRLFDVTATKDWTHCTARPASERRPRPVAPRLASPPAPQHSCTNCRPP